MKRIKLATLFSCASLLTAGLTSCVSTETLEPSSQTNDMERIVLNLTADHEENTRAEVNHEGYKLRYSAILYNTSFNNLAQATRKERQEILEGDKSSEGEENQIIFHAPKGTYTIIVYADYIPESYDKIEGEYGDYFYDTHTDRDRVKILRTPGNNTTEDVSNDFFNNDNYDFFCTVIGDIVKGEEKVTKSTTLNRSVAKVRVVDTSDFSGVYSLEINNLSSNVFYRLSTSAAYEGFGKPDKNNYEWKTERNQQLDDNGEKELFFYYSTAIKNANKDSDNTMNLKVKCTKENGEKGENYEKIFDNLTIPVQKNYITTIKGKFLPSSQPEPEPEIPEGDYIVVNIESITNSAWENTTQDWP